MPVRSSYATGLDTLYFSEELTADVQIPLTLNGNTFEGIEGLTGGRDYTYDSANWKQYMVKCTASVAKSAKGTRAKGIQIPVTFNGNRVRRVSAYQVSGRVGPNSDWWNYLKYDAAFAVDYQKGNFSLLNEFFADALVKDGLTKIVVEYYSGQKQDLWLNIEGETVSSNPDFAIELDEIGASDMICLYAGETEVPSQYLKAPEDASVYGTYISDDSVDKNNGLLTLEGWPAKLIFDTKAHDDFISCGIVIKCFDAEKYHYINQLGIKNAPIVGDITLESTGQTTQVTVSNLASDAKVTYATSDPEIATIDENGQVVGTGAGTAEILVTVQQYNRTDTFRSNIVVETDPNAPKVGDKFTNGKNNYVITGTANVAFQGTKNKSAKEVMIPKTVTYKGKTYKVTSIGAKAFYKNTKVTKITIGSNVKTIGANAFAGCKKLGKITINSGKLTKVGKNAWKGTTGG